MKRRLSKSLYRQVSKDAVIAEYARASRSQADFEKAKWGSHESMANRFKLGLSVVNWSGVKRWLDMGCGTGSFFTLAEDEGHRFEELVGVDITPEIICQARRRVFASPVQFIEADLEAIPDQFVEFDLITLIGVLQQCGSLPWSALDACVSRLKRGGQVFLTTKHLGWCAFSEGSLTPDPTHSWFDYGELAGIVQDLGIEIIQSGGFLPREGKIVTLAQSHTLYLVGIKGV